jgi:hypothetical protein
VLDMRRQAGEALHDFVIELGPAGGSGYTLRVESPAGSGTGLFVPPFGPERLAELLAAPAAREIVPEASPVRPSARRRPCPELAERSGAALFEALFAGKVGNLFHQSLGIAGSSGLRLQLAFDLEQTAAVPLANLPWELLFRPGNRSFLALGRATPILRRLAVERPHPTCATESPLCVLAVLSQACGLPRLDLQGELHRLERILRSTRGVEIDICRPADPFALRSALEAKRYHILHYMGHGAFDPVSGEGSLFLGKEDERPIRVSGTDLATALDGFTSLRLAVLNACSSARSGVLEAGNPFAGVAAALAQAGLPAVIAMQAPIEDRLAITFASVLYSRLVAGDTVESAIVAGRHVLRSCQPGSVAWAMPALFQRSGAERLFVVPAGRASAAARRHLRLYLKRLSEELRPLDTSGLPVPGALDLDQVFVPLRCRRRPSQAPLAPLAQHQPETCTADLAFSREHLLVLLGEPGSGKTTLLRHWAARLAATRAAHEREAHAGGRTDGAGAAPPVPILARAADFAAARARDASLTLAAFLARSTASDNEEEHELQAAPGADSPALLEILLDRLAAGEAAVLLDGLDDIGDASARAAVQRQIERFASAWCPAGNRVVVTCCNAAAFPSPRCRSAAVFELQPFDAVEVRCFRRRWLAATRTAGAGRPPACADAGSAATGSVPESELPGNPWLLTLACGLAPSERGGWAGRRGFPCRRAALLSTAVNALLEAWEQRARPAGGLPLARSEILEAFADLAATAHELRAAVQPGWLRAWLQRRFPERDADRLSRLLLDQAGWLGLAGGGAVQFRPAALQDYFTARHLAAETGERSGRWLARLGDPHWRRPVLLAIGLLSEELAGRELEDRLLAALAPGNPVGEVLPQAALWLTASLPELTQLPPRVASTLAARLFASYVQAGRPDRPAALRQPVERAFRALLDDSDGREAAEEVLAAALAPVAQAQEDQAPAAACLLGRLGGFTADLADRLAAAAGRDAAAWGWPIGSALRAIAARSPALLPDAPGSLRRTLVQRPDLATRLAADPSWLALAFVLYGGFAGAEGFAADRIERDSPLTPQILAALEQNWPAHGLVHSLWQIWRAARSAKDGEDLGARDALIALAVLGEPVAGELRRPGRLAARAADRMAEIARLLETEMAAAAHHGMTALQTLAVRLPADRWNDLVAALLATAGRSGERALQLLELEPHAAVTARAGLLSEVWHMPLAGPEPVFNFAVLLDVAGEPLACPPADLAASLAGAGDAVHAGRSHRAGWRLEQPTWRPSGSAALLGEALDALSGLADPFDFVRGWAVARLAPALAASGMTIEAVALAAGSLSDRFGARMAALEALGEAGAAWLDDAGPEAALLLRAAAIADDALRLRAYLQLARCFPDLRGELLHGDGRQEGSVRRTWSRLLSRALTGGAAAPAGVIPCLACALANPGGRAAAFIKLSDLDPPRRDHWLRRACASAAHIGDAEQRARLLGRLARRAPPGGARRLARRAWRAAAAIADGRRRAETLSALHRALPGTGLAAAAWRLGDEWMMNRALGRHGRLLWRHARDIAGPPRGLGTPLLVAARWSDLDQGRETAGRDPLRPPEAGGEDEIGERTIDALLAALQRGDDLTWSSAALALLGGRSDARRCLSATAAGRRAVEALAGRWLAVRASRPQEAQIIGWAMERIRHDDGGAISEWAARLAGQAAEAGVAEVLLSSIHDLHPRAWPAFRSQLASPATPVRRALLRSVCFLLARRRLPPPRCQEIECILDGWEVEGAGSDELDLELPASLVTAAEAGHRILARQPGAMAAAVEAAERSLVASGRRLADVLRGDRAARLRLLAAAGALWVAPVRHRQRLATAAGRIERTPQLLDVLIPWLTIRLAEGPPDPSRFRTVVADLLGLVTAAAERCPEQFLSRAAAAPRLARRLREAVELHPAQGGRRDGLRLLAHLGCPAPEALAAVRAALRDVPAVQAEALRTAGLCRQADSRALAQLIQDLRHPSALAAYAAARTLTAIAAAARLSAELRTEIGGAVITALGEPAARRQVHTLARVGREIRLESRTRLEDALAALLAELAGVTGDIPEAMP